MMNVSAMAVSKAVHKGRISTVEYNGKRFIDPEIAKEEWVKNSYDPNAEAEYASKEYESGELKTKAYSQYHTSRAMREGLTARMLQIELQQKLGKLVEADKVRVELFNMSRSLRDAYLSLADRLAPRIAPAMEPQEAHAMITEEIVKILENFDEAQRRLKTLS